MVMTGRIPEMLAMLYSRELEQSKVKHPQARRSRNFPPQGVTLSTQ